MRSGAGLAVGFRAVARPYLAEVMRLPVPEHIQGIAALLRVGRLQWLLVIREARAGMRVGVQALGRLMREAIIAGGRMCRVIEGEWVTLLPALSGLAAIIPRIR